MTNKILIMLMGGWFCLADHSAYSQTDFARDIKPILSANCFQCHGPDESTREANLRLDVESAGFAKVVGTQDNSELLRRLSTNDPAELMPPPESRKKRLSKQQVESITRWVAEGGKFSTHWSYERISRPQPPKVKDEGWLQNPIDRFVLARLENLGLKPSPPADHGTLLRRICLDLVGLPPASYVAGDLSITKYSEFIELLLASPAFGERMAIDWLDLVRYADTSGIHSDNPISMSPYRDYVIEAFNSNMPFDRFTREQLAGDLIPDASLNQKIASAYNRLNMMTTEGGAQDREYLAKYAADRVRTTSMTWLGSTLGCAECHDHKYDPFTTRDFYQFAAFFADITEKGYYPGAERSGDWGPKLSIPTRRQQEQVSFLENRIDKLRKNLMEESNRQQDYLKDWIKKIKQQDDWKLFENHRAEADSKTQLELLDDGSYLALGERADTDVYRFSTRVLPKKIQAVRVEVLPDQSLPKRGPGRAGNGNFVLTEIRLVLKTKAGFRVGTFKSAASTFDQTLAGEHTPYKRWHAFSAIDKDKFGTKPGWAVLPKIGQTHEAIFILDQPLIPRPAEELVIQMEQKHDNPGHVIGRFRLSFREEFSGQSPEIFPVSENLKKAVSVPAGERSDAQKKLIIEQFLKANPVIQDLSKKITTAEKELVESKKQWITVLTTVARQPREMRILPRGNWLDESGPVVSASYPSFFETTTPRRQNAHRLTRMDLANWIVSADNPLTARVQVNRLWKKFFGRGLVSTPEDFGSQGAVATHPKLLDYLAAEYMESGWDTKHIIRLIVSSATYQQSSRGNKSLTDVDPNNELLARQNSFRVEAEVVRDMALATSGLLVEQLGGRSVRPYQPSGYYQHLNFPRRSYQSDRGKNQYRKGLYTHWQRLFLHPAMLAFDAPSREECTAERVRSNTPQQALVLLNDPSYVEAARVLAERMIKAGGSAEEKIQFAFRMAFAREASSQERQVLVRIYETTLKEHGESGTILQVGDWPQTNSPELVAWTSVARVIFNLHEFTTRY